MARIEELEDVPPVSDPAPPPSTAETPFPLRPKPTEQDVTTTPSLPPVMDSVRSHTADEIVQMMKKTPLFMTDLTDGADDQEENIELEAFKALQYEGTRAEIALGFKERGNEMVAEKRWGDAKEFYTKGIAALKSAPASQVEGPASEDEQRKEREKERNLEEACYVNRALCNLELQNYRSTLHDTQHTLHLNPTSQKSLYRASLALLALSALPTTPPTTSETHLTTAIDLVARGIALTSPTLTSTNISSPPSPQNTAFTTLRARLLAAQSLLQTTARKRETQEEAKRREKMVLNAALHARGIRVRFTDRGGGGPDLEDAGICLRPDPGSAMSEVWFPVLVLYPCHGRSDFLKGVGETSSWGEVVGTVLEEQPLDWDVEGEYILGGVQCFVETKEGGVMKVGMKVRLLDVLAGGKVEVVDQVVRVFVVPRGRLEGWVAEMKARKERKKS